jgi:thiamine-monophosphate kinase
MNELEIVEWVRRRSRTHSSILTGVGDDMAVIAAPTDKFLLSSDMLLDGVHFDSKIHTFRQIGRKAVARALSDCAAMAVRPTAVLVSVALPKDMPSPSVEELFEAMHVVAEEFGAGVAGGDTARWDAPLAIDISIAAEPYPGIAPIRRDGARINDLLYTTGRLGGSILGKHLTFVPRIQEARTIAARLGGDLRAMIDISDGLALDLWRMCEASSVGALLDETSLSNVISSDARLCAAKDGVDCLHHVLSDGEDYELLVAASPSADTTGLSLIPIGRIVAGGLGLTRLSGQVETLQPRGYVH